MLFAKSLFTSLSSNPILKSHYFRWTVLCIFLLIGLSIHTRWKQTSSRKRMEKFCSSNGNQTIFVALISEHSSISAAKTLFSIFDNAACPKRIRVGLYEIVEEDEESEDEGIT